MSLYSIGSRKEIIEAWALLGYFPAGRARIFEHDPVLTDDRKCSEQKY